MTLAQCARAAVTIRGDRERVARALQERMARYGTSSEYIARRQVSVLTSRFVKHDPDNESEPIRRYGDLRNPTGETLDERMNLFEEVACDVFERVYRDPERAASRRHRARELLGVRLAQPGSELSLAARLARRRRHAFVPHGMLRRVSGDSHGGRASSDRRTFRFRKRKRRVDLVHTEFLSLHFDLLGDEPDNFVTSTLFADGFIKYAAYPQSEFDKERRSGLKILAIDEYILPDSLPEMTLRPGPLQFDMSLSKRVPFMIRDSIGDFVRVDLRAGRSRFRARKGGDDLRDPSRAARRSSTRFAAKLGIEESADRAEPAECSTSTETWPPRRRRTSGS